jgi:hypothetical protein
MPARGAFVSPNTELRQLPNSSDWPSATSEVTVHVRNSLHGLMNHARRFILTIYDIRDNRRAALPESRKALFSGASFPPTIILRRTGDAASPFRPAPNSS